MEETHNRPRLQIAGPHDLSHALRRQLSGNPHFELLKPLITADDDLIAAVKRAEPDLLLLDMEILEPVPREMFTALSALKSPPRIVAMAPTCEPQLALAQQVALTRATLLREMALSPLLGPVLQGVTASCTYFVPSPGRAGDFHLTAAELGVLRLMAVGIENNRLVRELRRTRHSLYYAQSQIRRKLDVETNEQAIVAAIRHGLVGVLTKPDCLPQVEQVA
jgi:DNA-binding CsgD family transcriptional regulator